MGTIASDSIQLESIKDVYDTAEGADTKADTAQATADATAEHFWTDSSGAHVTEVDRATYEADPANAGGNTLIKSNSMDIRDGTDILASFGAAGAQIGKNGEANTTITSNGIVFKSKNGAVAGRILSNAAVSGTVVNDNFGNPMHSGTFSLTLSQSPSAGVNTPANVYIYRLVNGAMSQLAVCDYYENGGVQSLDTPYQAIIPYNPTPTPQSGTVVANVTITNTGQLEIEMLSPYANTDVIVEVYYYASTETPTIAFGQGTSAESGSQFVVGKYNQPDSSDVYAVIVGNGTDDANRSNALTVDWSGNVEATGDVSAGGSKCMTVADWTETIIKGGTTVTNTNQSVTLNESVNNFAFIRVRLYTSSAAMSVLVNPETILTKVNDTYVPSKYLMRLGTTNHYLQITAVSETQLTIRLESAASNTYCNMWGYGRLAN